MGRPFLYQTTLGATLPPYATHTRRTVERTVTFSSAEESTMLTLVQSGKYRNTLYIDKNLTVCFAWSRCSLALVLSYRIVYYTATELLPLHPEEITNSSPQRNSLTAFAIFSPSLLVESLHKSLSGDCACALFMCARMAWPARRLRGCGERDYARLSFNSLVPVPRIKSNHARDRYFTASAVPCLKWVWPESDTHMFC